MREVVLDFVCLLGMESCLSNCLVNLVTSFTGVVIRLQKT